MKQRGFIPKTYTHLVFAFYMSALMALLMSSLLVALNTGVDGQYMSRVLHAYIVAMPVAFCCVTLVRPVVMKLVNITIRHDTHPQP